MMLFQAEIIAHTPIEGAEQTTTWAWLGPMTDEGFLQIGYVAAGGERVWMYVSAVDAEAAKQRLDDLPIVRDGSVTFTLTSVTVLRFR